MKPLVISALPPLHADGARYFGQAVDFRVASDPSAATIIREGRDAVAIVARGGTFIDAQVYDALERLLIVVATGSGADCFDVPAASERGIAVLNNPGRIVGVPEYVMGVIPLLSKRLLEMDRSMRRGDSWWSREQSGYEVSGKTIGIVGFGHLGREVARRTKAGFAMSVIAYDPIVEQSVFDAEDVTRAATLDWLLKESDFVTLHVPLLDATRHLIAGPQLATMKETAILVNASRGAVVDERALVEALQRKQIRGAAIDVWDPEPPAPHHPLFSFDNVLVTPHMAGVTTETRAAGAKQLAETTLTALRGAKPKSVVDPAAWPPKRAERTGFPLTLV